MNLLNNTLIFLQSSNNNDLLDKLNQTTEKATPGSFSAWDNILQLLGLCILLVIILIAAYYTSRFVGKYKLGQLRSSNFEVIESYKINLNNLLLLVRIADRYVVLGVSKDHITFITELEKDKILTREVKEVEKLSFNQILDRFKSKKE
ncbi:MAG TPA: flagellar biosynthetic protein FliO [Mobilitalea sp.]|nr:flagellar biosynthetic protein FliO [Mobilitalea sp.]